MRLDRFPDTGWAKAWAWLMQCPAANFDDFGPRNLPAFIAEMRARLAAGEVLWAVRGDDDELVGIVGFRPASAYWGMFHGICFDQRVHGSGLPRDALRAILAEIFAAGFGKVSAWYFADNRRVHHFLAALGAVREGTLRRQALRGGLPVDMYLVAFVKP